MSKIDWPNHLIGFFSALFGILIAFELDEWKESRKDEQIAENAFVRLQQEIDINRNMLHEMVKTNLELIEGLRMEILTKVDHQLVFTGSHEQANAINANEQLSNFAFVNGPRDPSGNFDTRSPIVLHVSFSGLVHAAFHNSAWESAKTIGALNNMSYEKVLSLSALYNPTRVLDELDEIRALLRTADEVTNKAELEKLLDELSDAYRIIGAELDEYDAFAAMLEQME